MKPLKEIKYHFHKDSNTDNRNFLCLQQGGKSFLVKLNCWVTKNRQWYAMHFPSKQIVSTIVVLYSLQPIWHMYLKRFFVPYICRPNLSTTSDMMPFREGRCFSMCEPDDLSHRDDKLMKPIGTIHILRNHLGGRWVGVKKQQIFCILLSYF